MEHEGDGDTNCNWSTWNNSETIGKGTGRQRNQRISGELSEYSITKIGSNTEKSIGHLKRLTVPQSSVKKTSANPGVKNP